LNQATRCRAASTKCRRRIGPCVQTLDLDATAATFGDFLWHVRDFPARDDDRRRFKAGHRIRVFLTSDDQYPKTPVLMSFRHASVGTSSNNTITSASRLLLPFIPTVEPLFHIAHSGG